MKSNVPWSIKGIDPEARDAAKRAAREAGMTLGEWLNHQIIEASGVDPSEMEDDDDDEPVTASPVTLDHLRELVSSLNRLNERLQNSEKSSQQAIGSLNQGLTSALERIHAMERARSSGSDSNEALISRIERIESGAVDRRSIDGLQALEKALTRTLHQFESIREETLTRVEANETAIQGLTTRVDTMDEQLGAAIRALRDNVDEINGQIETTERSVAQVMEEARAAASSNDEEFIQRTSNKMRILGNEIKRTSDRIQSLDEKVLKLAGKIDASEQRSAEGISQISQTVTALSRELISFDQEQGEAVVEARKVIESASHHADDRLSVLKKSFDTMLMRIEGIADGEKALEARPPVAPPPAPPAPTEPAPKAPEPEAKAPEPKPAPRDNVPSDEDFDAIFGEPIAQDPDPWFDDEPPALDVPPPADERQSLLAEDDEPEADDSRPPIIKPEETLTPKQKVILAARARRKRMQEQAVTTEPPAPKSPQQEVEPPLSLREEPAPRKPVSRPAAPEPAPRAEPEDSQTDRIRRKYLDRSGGFPVIPIIVAGLALVIVLGFIMWSDMFTGSISQIDQPSNGSTTPVTPEPGPSPEESFARAKTAIANGRISVGLEELYGVANSGYPPAQFLLAELNRTGTHLQQNLTEARRLYQEAAEGGNVAAMHRLGSMYLEGEGGDRNDYTALSWFEQAASYGYVNSIYNLGLLYDPGVELGIEDQILNSAPQAYYWYSLAARLGDEDAAADAASLGQSLSEAQRQQIDQEVAAWMAQRPIRAANVE